MQALMVDGSHIIPSLMTSYLFDKQRQQNTCVHLHTLQAAALRGSSNDRCKAQTFLFICVQGVMYSHRSNFLHAMVVASGDVMGLSSTSCFYAIVPLFHANSWGLVFAAPMTGTRLVLPGHSPLRPPRPSRHHTQLFWPAASFLAQSEAPVSA